MKKFESVIEPLMWSMALLLIALAAGCGGGGGDPILGGGGGGGVAAISVIPGGACSGVGPKVTLSDPTNGNPSASTSTISVAPNKLIIATFDQAMSSPTVTSAFTLAASGVPVAGTVTMNPANTVATLATSGALSTGTLYTATITQNAQSASAVSLACPYQWTFTTAASAVAGLAPVTPGLLAPFGIASFGGMTDLTGPTKINGDAVLHPTQTCGATAVGLLDNYGPCNGDGSVPPTNNPGDRVVTSLHPADGTAVAVMTELNNKWNSISPAGVPGATVLPCGVIGSAGGCIGLTSILAPGAYIANIASIGITGNLILDGGGDQNAVFVFQSPASTLTANVGSKVILINGAKASNVWWFVGSAATINGVEFQGNILASDSISLGTGAKTCGRMLSGASGAGALTLLTNTVSVPGNPNAPPTDPLNIPATCQ